MDFFLFFKRRPSLAKPYRKEADLSFPPYPDFIKETCAHDTPIAGIK